MTEEIIDTKIFADSGIRPNAERAKIAQYLIFAVLLMDIVSFVSSYMQVNLLTAMKNGEMVTQEMADANDLREQIIGLVYLAVMIVSSVTFIMWFRRGYYNLGKRANPMYTNGWAAGAWFVPIISLFRPFQIMKEMWEKTTNLINSKSDIHKFSTSTTILGVWWALWIISSFVGNYVTRTSFKAETIENFINSSISDMVLSALGIPLAIVAVLVIKQYNAREEKLVQLEMDEQIAKSLN